MSFGSPTIVRTQACVDSDGLVNALHPGDIPLAAAQHQPPVVEEVRRLRRPLLALDPDVMLYDEPTTGLDPIMTDVINELILRTRAKRPVTSVIVTHEMRTVQKCAARVVMFYPLSRLVAGEPQVLFDGPPEKLASAADERVRQFVEGQARERLSEMNGPS